MREDKTTWSDCGQIFCCDSWGYGLTPKLNTICLGNETDIKKFFETGKPNEELEPIQRQVLLGIREFRKEQGIGIREGDLVGASYDGASRRNKKAIKSPTLRQRLALRASHKKH